MSAIHPLSPLQPVEVRAAVAALRSHIQRGPEAVRIKLVDLFEPPKRLLIQYFADMSTAVSRRARAYYHVKGSTDLGIAIINITNKQVELNEYRDDVQGPVDWTEYDEVHKACNTHPDVLAEIERLKLPPGAKVLNDPWAYGTDNEKERRRLFQCYMYIVLNDDPEANHYSLPAPFAPIFDAHTLELVAMERLPLGKGTDLDETTQPWQPRKAVEYSAKVLGDDVFRKDVRPLQVIQPEGPSFEISGRQVNWQKWSFYLGWTLREGPVLHNVTYEGRSLFHRVSMSEMTVPYGDPRSPFHRKQAFDLGDSGFGLTSNSLSLGCDCLGHIAYFDGIRVTADGEPVEMPQVVCMHEVDQGIGWKHTNWRNGKASVVRDRQLVVQCTATVANYEYILAFIMDQAANLHVEVKATGIVSTMPVNDNVKSPWGTVVAPGVLAVNHQHLFCMRIDPAIDGQKNSITYEDCIPVRDEPEIDPFGCAFRVKKSVIDKAGGYDLDLTKSRTYKIVNPSKINKISGQPVGYKLHAVPSQMMMMAPHTFNQKRGIFSSKPIWVTKYQDDQLYAAGEFTNQSRGDTGLAKWIQNSDPVDNEDVVLWHTFGVTHITRPEGTYPHFLQAPMMLIAFQTSP